MEYPVLRTGHIGHHGLGIVDDNPVRNPTVERQRPYERIQNHLLALARIGNHERLAAVTKAEMGELDLLLNTSQDNPFFAPVELKGVTRWQNVAG